MAHFQNGGKRHFKLNIRFNLKVARRGPYWKMADLKVCLALIQNNSRRHTVNEN